MLKLLRLAVHRAASIYDPISIDFLAKNVKLEDVEFNEVKGDDFFNKNRVSETRIHSFFTIRDGLLFAFSKLPQEETFDILKSSKDNLRLPNKKPNDECVFNFDSKLNIILAGSDYFKCITESNKYGNSIFQAIRDSYAELEYCKTTDVFPISFLINSILMTLLSFLKMKMFVLIRRLSMHLLLESTASYHSISI